MGLVLLFACTVASLTGGAACIFALARHGRRVLGRALRAAIGSLLVWSWAVALLGYAEGVYTVSDPYAWVLGALGVCSLWFIGGGAAAALQKRKHGHCRKCGYDQRGVPDLSVCPECGAAT